MKHLLKYNNYFLKESEETTNDEHYLEYSEVVVKKFFRELKSHLIYWFEFGKLKKDFIADRNDVQLEKRGVCVWANDTEEKYEWRIKFLEHEIQGNIKKMEKVLMKLSVYSYDDELLLKQYDIIIPVKDLNEDFLLDKMKKVKESIIKTPENEKDIEEFRNKESEQLTDDIY